MNSGERCPKNMVSFDTKIVDLIFAERYNEQKRWV